MNQTQAPKKTKIQLPYKFQPRPYQIPLLAAMDSGYKRGIGIWHRRAGKDKLLINYVAKKMMERVGAYYYVYPTYNQARKAIWDGFDRDGFKFTDHFPHALRYRTDKQEMLIQFVHPSKMSEEDPNKPAPGSIFRLIGSDNIDSIMGTNPIGVVFSEYSLQDPQAWDFIRPILAENGGWAIFNYTPRGHNHGKQLWDIAGKFPEVWYRQRLTVEDSGAIPVDVLEQEKAEMFERTGSDALFMQEYHVSFDAPVEGAYYGRQMIQAEKDKRITNVPYDPQAGFVNTYWDLGMDDSTTIWFTQTVGKELRLIDYLEDSGEGLEYYAKQLRAMPYIFGEHWMPHDIVVKELGTGKSRKEMAESFGLRPIRVAPKLSVEEGINAARTLLSRCWFDDTKTIRGRNALNSYAKEWDEKNKVYKNHPRHDWASHGADAFRTLAVAYKPPAKAEPLPDDNLFTDGFY